MALHFKDRYSIDDFCGYVFSRASLDFLQTQKEITYGTLLLDEEVHERYKQETLDIDYLKAFEEAYGIPNLWPYIEVDRLIRHGQFIRDYPHNTSPYSHEEMLRVFQVHAKAAVHFFDEEKPDCLILSVIGNIGTMLLYHLAKKRDLPVFFIETTRVGNQFTITENIHTLSYVEDVYKKLQSKAATYPDERARAHAYVEAFRKAPTPHSSIDSPNVRPVTRGRQFSFLFPKKMFISFRWLIHTYTSYIFDPQRNDYDMIKPWHYLWDRLKRKMRVLIGFDDLYDNLDLTKSFAFYPLQHEPEISLSLFAPFYNDQIWVIKQVAKSLPIDFVLYVKEHPSTFGYRSRFFYKELKKIPQVRLISPTEVSFGITERAKLVFTSTGTTGFEALMLKKPVIVFGDVFYSLLPMVKRCAAVADLPYLIKEQLERHTHDEVALIDLITAVYKESAEIDLTQIWDIDGTSFMEKKKQAVIPLTDLIASKLRLMPR